MGGMPGAQVPSNEKTHFFYAKPGDYQKAVQRIYRAGDNASEIEVPLLP
jgi:uncharacterized protein